MIHQPDGPCKGNVGYREACMGGYGGDGWEISGFLYNFVFLDTLEPTKTLYEVRRV